MYTQDKGLNVAPMMVGLVGIVMVSMIPQLIPVKKCTPGETKCDGYDLYQCNENCQWVLIEQNSPTCGYVPAGLFHCPYCDESFDTLSELVAHVAAVHPDKPPIQEVDITWS